ncbi:MAG: peptidoglycan-binding domain-containing protein, partial [Syntrophomonas sp.]
MVYASRYLRLEKNSMTGPDVLILQNQLIKLNHDIGAIDGIYGKKTEKAVKAFQAKSGLNSDGVVDPNTWNFLNLAIPLEPGALAASNMPSISIDVD